MTNFNRIVMNMAKPKEVKGPRVIFDDRVRYQRAGVGAVQIEVWGVPELPKFDSGYSYVEGVYSADGTPLWQNDDFPNHRIVRPRKYKGLQIAFSDRVTFTKGDRPGDARLKYEGPDGVDYRILSYGLVRAVYTQSGRQVLIR